MRPKSLIRPIRHASLALLSALMLPLSGQAQAPSSPAPAAWVARPVMPAPIVVAPGRHVVKPGDTITRIAARTGASVEDIARINGLKPPYIVKAGQKLTIPGGRYHRVRRGETGIAIARAYGTSWSQIIALNKLGEPYQLREGQRLLLPDVAITTPVPTRLPPAAPATASTPSAPPPGSLEARASRFRIDIDDIVTGGEPALADNAKPAPPSASPTRPLPPTVPVAAPTGAFTGQFSWPVKGRILRPFGNLGNGRHNDGINIAAPWGSPILAAADGVVAYVGTEVAIYGGLILIRHADSWITAYGHAERLQVTRGQAVKKGQLLGYVAQGGLEEQDQLHFQIRQGRTPIDPIGKLPPRGG